MGQPTIRVVIADDDLRMLIYYEAILHRMPDMQVVGSTPDSEKVLSLVQEQRPHVLLMDHAIEPPAGEPLLALMRRERPDVALITLGGRSSRHSPQQEEGVFAHLSIPVTPKNLVTAIRAAYKTFYADVP